QAGGVGSVEVGERSRTTDPHRVPELAGDGLGEAGDGAAGAAEDDLLDRDRPILGAVVVEREAELVGELADALLERLTSGGDDLGIAVDLLGRIDEADVTEPLPGVLEGQLAALRE